MSDVLKKKNQAAAPASRPLYFVQRIGTLPSGLFRLDGDDPAVVIPIRDRYGCLCDLAAYREDDPGEWWIKEGDKCPILGARELAGAPEVPAPIHLWPTPQDWLTANGCGVCVIDWRAPLFDLFRDVKVELRHLDDAVQRALRGRLWVNFRQDVPVILGGKRGRNAA